MTKKFKLKNLEEEPVRIGQLDRTRAKVSIDDLKDETSVRLELPTRSAEVKPQESRVFKAKDEVPKISPQKVVISGVQLPILKDTVEFERDLLKSYVLRIISFGLALGTFDLLLHLLKRLEGIDILSPKNFDSIIFVNEMNLNIVRVFCFLFVVYLLTPKDKLILNRKGIRCRKVEIISLFFTSEWIFIQWNEIAKVEYRIRFFEPFIFFYDHEGIVLGQIDYSINDSKNFFQTVGEYASKYHPLYQARAKLI